MLWNVCILFESKKKGICQSGMLPQTQEGGGGRGGGGWHCTPIAASDKQWHVDVLVV